MFLGAGLPSAYSARDFLLSLLTTEGSYSEYLAPPVSAVAAGGITDLFLVTTTSPSLPSSSGTREVLTALDPSSLRDVDFRRPNLASSKWLPGALHVEPAI